MKTTQIIKVKGDWQEVLNDCRSTVGKEALSKDPSDSFKKRILISEHSPIRNISFKWIWKQMPHWITVHWVRHKWECFVRTQRSDRTGIPREELNQLEPQDFIGEMNIQNAIDTMRKRLCCQASKETREYAENLKFTLHEEVDLYIADVLVPNCIYRCGCPEAMGNTCTFFSTLVAKTEGAIIVNDIQLRYDIYNDWFYKSYEKQIINEMLETLTENELCFYCKYHNDGCEGEITCNGAGVPIYPPCADLEFDETELDIKRYLKDKEKE